MDTELLDAVPPDSRAAASRVLLGDAHEVPRGPWTPDLIGRDGGCGFALLIVDGLVRREVALAGRQAAQVFGPGDMVRPAGAADSSLRHDVEWTVMQPAVVVALDDVFLAAARRWPRLVTVLNDRLFAQVDRVAVHLAIAQLPRIEQRLVGMLWHLADRFGHVTAAGVVVPFALTHDELGRLVGARRPTVSLGLAALHEDGRVRRRPDGCWLLDPASNALAPSELPAATASERPPLRIVAAGGG